MSELNYAVAVSGLEPIQAPPTPDGQAAHWSPLSHTLIYGPTAAVVVDPPITKQQSVILADWIEARGTSLEYIYVTHWHGDHWFGTPELLRRFPGATVLASAATIERMRASVEGGAVQGLWTNLFGDRISDGAALATAASRADAVPADGFEIDGHRLYSVEVGHSDTDDSTVLHAPSLGLVAAGDVVYNNVHQYLAETPNGGLAAWHRALDVVAGLAPRHVVAGHKDSRRPDAVSTIDETRRYLDATAVLLDDGLTREELFARVLELYPDRVNPFTIWLNALRLVPDSE